MGAMKALREEGLAIPQDVSIAGFDDIEMASYFEPGLTTIHQPAYEMGQKAAHLLLDILSGVVQKPQQIILEHQLVVRSSCSPPARIGGG
jgi:DNA-binding LacI/PurR family transcriptional regulator